MSMFNTIDLVQFALGPDQAMRVDSAIPQTEWDAMPQIVRADTAGWYYDPWRAPMFGRLLTKTECWKELRRRLQNGVVVAEMQVGSLVTWPPCGADWPCLEWHLQQGHLTLRWGNVNDTE